MEFAIVDSGVGISTEAQTSIFELFTREETDTTRQMTGTGLGLAITKALVELMGGEIQVESELNQGARFIFTCPLETVAGSVQPETDPLDRRERRTYDRRVLVVDDNPTNRLVAQRMLQRLGCEVQCADDGRDAVQKAREHAFDLILMDVAMPVMDGYEATREIRDMDEAIARTPIVAMTAYAMPGDRERCLDAGMDDYVTKPMRIGEVERVLMTLQNPQDRQDPLPSDSPDEPDAGVN